MKCPNCGTEISESMSKCPKCGMYYERMYTDPPFHIGGTFSTFFYSGAMLIASHIDSPQSASSKQGEQEFQQYWITLPEELSKAVKDGQQAIDRLDKEVKRRDKATRIITLIRYSNAFFLSKKKAELFNENHPELTSHLFSPYESINELPSKIAGLYSFFEVELDPLRKIVKDPDDRKSIKLIKKWLNDESIPHDAKMIECWEKIGELRSLVPLHAKKPEDIFARARLP